MADGRSWGSKWTVSGRLKRRRRGKRVFEAKIVNQMPVEWLFPERWFATYHLPWADESPEWKKWQKRNRMPSNAAILHRAALYMSDDQITMRRSLGVAAVKYIRGYRKKVTVL